MKNFSITLALAIALTSCVSKKKYVALEKENGDIKSELLKTKIAKEDLSTKFDNIQKRVNAYNAKIASLKEQNDSKLDVVNGVTVISNATRAKMRETLANVDQELLSNAKTLKDSMNLAVAHNLKHAIKDSNINEDDDFAVNINETVVMISIADNMLFNTGSYRLSSKADAVLKKLADVINSEPSLDVMVEGHTDARTINTEFISDNWDLSVLRATSVVRKLQGKYNVAPEKLIAAGRSSYQPIADNTTGTNRAKNRRTRIIILPNINKFFALMAKEDTTIAENTIQN